MTLRSLNGLATMGTSENVSQKINVSRAEQDTAVKSAPTSASWPRSCPSPPHTSIPRLAMSRRTPWIRTNVSAPTQRTVSLRAVPANLDRGLADLGDEYKHSDLHIAIVLRPRAEAEQADAFNRGEVALMLATLQLSVDVQAFMANLDGDADGKTDEAEVLRMIEKGTSRRARTAAGPWTRTSLRPRSPAS